MMNWILQGDCLELMKDIEDKSVDMILCDLPYGRVECKWDIIIPFNKLWEQYKRIISDNAVIVLTASQPFTSKLIISNITLFKYCWIWEKPQGIDPFLSKIRPLNNYEDIVVFSNGKTKYFPQKSTGKPYILTRDKGTRKSKGGLYVRAKETTTYNNGDRLPKRIIKFKQQKGMHPTQKPVALFEYLIKTYTNEGDLVLDNCVGSGTTNIACLNTNRQCIGMEKDEEYFRIATERLDKAKSEVRTEDIQIR